jgi:phage baseplate assembly protein W
MRTNQVIKLDNQDLQNLKQASKLTTRAQAPTLQIISDRSEYSGQPIRGLTFPLQIENGTLKISTGEDRIVEQILEVLQTSVGERVYRQFFGLPNLVFESISESVLERRIERQLQQEVKANNIIFKTKVRSISPEQVVVLVTYQLSSRAPQTIKYVVQ